MIRVLVAANSVVVRAGLEAIVSTSSALSEHTVKFHIGSIFSNLNATSRTEAVMLGARQGLILL